MKRTAIALWGIAVAATVLLLTSSSLGVDAKTIAVMALAMVGAIVAPILSVAGKGESGRDPE